MTTPVEVHPVATGGYIAVERGGEVSHPRVKHPFTVVRHHRHAEDGAHISTTTYLHGVRGGVYLLRPYLGEDCGNRQMISMKGGGEYRVKGNAVQVIEVAGIIEFLK